MLQLKGLKNEAQKLKVNWRFLTKNRWNIKKTWYSFRAPKFPLLTESLDEEFRKNYKIYSNITEVYEVH